MAWEERARVSVWATSEKHKVEDGELNGVFGCKGADEGLFVLVGEFLGVACCEDFGVNLVDVGGTEGFGNEIEEFLLEGEVIGVGVVCGDGALVGKEDFPGVELEAGVGGQRGVREVVWEGTARNGDTEGFVTAESGILGVDDGGCEGGRELLGAGERVECGLAGHGCCGWLGKGDAGESLEGGKMWVVELVRLQGLVEGELYAGLRWWGFK